MPTGGVTLEDAADRIAAGAVGLGSALTAGDVAQTGARLGELRARLAQAAA